MLNNPKTSRRRLTVHAARIGVAVGAMFVTLTTVGGHADAQATPTADLQLQMTTTPSNVEPGGTFTYNATVTNLGPDPTVSTQFQVDIVPASAATVTAATASVGSCNVQPDAVFCGTLGPVARNASVTVTVTVTVGASAPVGTVITGNALTNAPGVPDPSSGNNNVIVTNNVVAPQATTTTTTTAPATTTTAPGAVAAPTTAIATTTTAAGALPATGSSETGLALVALAAIAVGGSLVVAARRPRRTS